MLGKRDLTEASRERARLGFRPGALSVPEPPFQVATMNDAEDKDHPVFVDGVVHHPVVADAESVERVAHAVERLDGLAADSTRLAGVSSQHLKRLLRSQTDLGRQLLEGSGGRRPELDAICGQTSSLRLIVRPFT